jgi:hypothetical protein
MKQIQTNQKQLRKQLKRELEQKCRIAFEGLNDGGAKSYFTLNGKGQNPSNG